MQNTQKENLVKAVQNNILNIIPTKNVNSKIYITESKSAWITIEWLSDELMFYAKQNYVDLFEFHPTERGKVVLYEENIDSFRWHQSYLNTPDRDKNLYHNKKSYMYSGKENTNNLSLPTQFQCFLDFLNNTENLEEKDKQEHKQEDKQEDKYNQITANWYANGGDYIAPHSDCQINMKPNAGIAILSLNEDENNPRNLIFTPKKADGIETDNIYQNVKILMKQGCIITMFGDTQTKFRHKIPKDAHISTSRISLTFRKF